MSPLETNLASPPGGSERKYYWATGYEGDVIGGAAVLHPRYKSPLETNLASPPGGSERKYYWATGYEGDVIGGAASACKRMFNS